MTGVIFDTVLKLLRILFYVQIRSDMALVLALLVQCGSVIQREVSKFPNSNFGEINAVANFRTSQYVDKKWLQNMFSIFYATSADR